MKAKRPHRLPLPHDDSGSIGMPKLHYISLRDLVVASFEVDLADTQSHTMARETGAPPRLSEPGVGLDVEP